MTIPTLRRNPLLLAVALLLFAQGAAAAKVETVAVVIGAAVFGVDAGLAAMQQRDSFAERLARRSRPEGWLLNVETLSPREGFAEVFRDIDVSIVEVGRAWQLPWALEFQLAGGVLVAEGEVSEPLSPNPPQDSDAWGLHAGPALRLETPRWHGWQAFAESSAHLLWTPDEFPAGGTHFNGLIRRGLGLTFALGGNGQLELGYRRAHVSNGSGTGSGNPSWDGDGFWAGWRMELGAP
jgi:hypothetical protein